MDFVFLIIPLAFVMGFVNSISGGGGVFGVPALIAMGLPPVNALALNRISDLGNIIGSLHNYTKIPDFRWKVAAIAIPPILAGAFVGANLIVGLEEALLNKIIIGAVCVGMVFLLYPVKPKPEDTKPHYVAGMFSLLLLGLWDGAFAMAGGTFGVLIFVLLFHRSYVGAKGIMTLAAVPETLLSMSILWLHSSVDLKTAAIMITSTVFGSYIGSKIAIQKGSPFIRYAMVLMALIMVLKIVVFDILKLA